MYKTNPAAHERQKATARAWYYRNKAHIHEWQAEYYKHGGKDRAYELRLRKRWGLTWADYSTMIAAQGGVCAICGSHPKARFCIDHDTQSGSIRGLLCGRCNRSIGHMEHRPDWLRKAADYLDR